MNIVVCMKQTVDTAAPVSIGDGGSIDYVDAKPIVNPYDEYAIEQAVQLKEAHGGSVCVVSVGPKEVEESMRVALAMGADEALRIDAEGVPDNDERAVATLLAAAVARRDCDLVVVGRSSSDNASGQVPQRLAEQLGMAALADVTAVTVDGGRIEVRRACPEGVQTVQAQLPVVLAAQKGLNEPRFASFAGLMKAKRVKIEVLTAADLGVSADQLAASKRLVGRSLPPSKAGAVRLEGDAAQMAQQLASRLHTEAKVI